MIELDGSEGGGQILRSALALSLITGKGFLLNNIRAGRPNPGLQAQHLQCVHAAASLCKSAIVEGAELWSMSLRFVPGKLEPKDMKLDIGTAGSITLLLQSLLPVLILGSKKITLDVVGGTDVAWSMPYDYFKEVFLPQLTPYVDVKCELIKRGYYPKGSGHVRLSIKPKYTLETVTQAQPLMLLDQGKLVSIKGVSHASKDLQTKQVTERQAQAAQLELKKTNLPLDIVKEYVDTLSTGSGITLWAIAIATGSEGIEPLHPIRLGGDALGERKLSAEDVGFNAAHALLSAIHSKTPVDKHLGDNLVPYLALFSGRIRVEDITDHTKTNIKTCEAFLGNIFTIDAENKIITMKKPITLAIG